MVNRTVMNGFSYTMDRLNNGDNPDIEEILDKYQKNDIPKQYQWTDMDKCSPDFERGARQALIKFRN